MKNNSGKTKRGSKLKGVSVGFETGHPFHSDSVMFRIDDSQVSTLIDLNTGNYFSLNAFGTLVWRLADGTRNVAEIKAILARHLKMTDKSNEQVDEFLRGMVKRGFINFRKTKLKMESLSSEFLNDLPKDVQAAAPKISPSKAEPLNVFGVPGY
ncbi:MAG: PqqD family protein [Bdellovibrionales bacterium]